MSPESHQEQEERSCLSKPQHVGLEQESSSTMPPPTTWEIPFLLGTFLVMMVLHEIAVEAASREFGIHLNLLPYAVALSQHGFCCLLPILFLKKQQESLVPNKWYRSPLFVSQSCLQMSSAVLSSMSLRYLNYTTKIIFKSTNPLVIAKLQTTNNHNDNHVVAILMVMIGLMGYAWDEVTTENNHYHLSRSFGLILLATSVVLEAWVPSLQEKLKMTLLTVSHGDTTRMQQHRKRRNSDEEIALDADTESCRMDSSYSATCWIMMHTNAFGFILVLGALVVSGQFSVLVSTCRLYPQLVMSLLTLGFTLACATMCMNSVLEKHPKNDNTTTMTVICQKTLTTVLSYKVFPKMLLDIHIYSSVSVLAGALLLNRQPSKQ